MSRSALVPTPSFRQWVSLAVVLLVGCASHPYSSAIRLEGAQEVPPVTTLAKGKGEITVLPDHIVSGSIKVSGVVATAAHIHIAATGKNGPVIITLVKKSDDTFDVPAGAKLNNAQYAAYQAGNLYVNVHSAAHPGGEVRAQIKPAPPPESSKK